jgi:predicted kinase
MIQVLCGTIGSGKSTYAKTKAKEGCIIVNDDSIVNAVHADQYDLYNKDLKPLYKGAELFILNTAIAMGKDVVVDKGISLSVNSRQRWISIGRSLDIPVQCVLFQFFSPEIHAERRAGSDDRGLGFDYWLKVAKVHFASYEEPTVGEGFSAVVTREWK